ncbi:alpha/beta fold hydrolase [Profundibacter sp.]|uniref:alpha/beta fold hydrolase n=1 Tax=Profundibacter sp. TaxID=3101071 RepID=UPI003D11EA4E
MQSKSIQLGIGKINYYESAGTGPAILLIHGNSASGKCFQNQIEGSLGENFRVVAIDLPGHGGSDPFENMEDYNFPAYARVIVDVASALNMDEAVFAGWSLGGHAVLEASSQLVNAAGFVIFGTPPLAFPPAMEEAFLPNPAMAAAFNPTLSPEEAKGFADAFFAEGTNAPELFIDDIQATDGNARAGMAASIAPDGYADEVEIVANLSKPLAIMHGSDEMLVNGDYFSTLNMPTLWRQKVQIIKGAGHIPQWEQADTFNRLLAGFVKDVSRS